MLTKGIAFITLAVLLVLNHFGNFWFVYGIWPQSWFMLGVFTLTTIGLQALGHGLLKEDH